MAKSVRESVVPIFQNKFYVARDQNQHFRVFRTLQDVEEQADCMEEEVGQEDGEEGKEKGGIEDAEGGAAADTTTVYADACMLHAHESEQLHTSFFSSTSSSTTSSTATKTESIRQTASRDGAPGPRGI